MQVVILVAGYATRMYPLTEHCPKALLPVRGVQIIDYILGKVFAIQQPGIERVTLVSNHRFHGHFVNWQRWREPHVKLEILDDGSTTDENRLGAIGDIQFAIEKQGIDGNLLVLAGDNLFQFDLTDLVRLSEQRDADCVIVRKIEGVEARRRTGIVVLDGDSRVTDFEEKPKQPRSHWGVPPIYAFRRDTVPLIGQYLREDGNPDAPGNFIAWLHKRKPVYALRADGHVLDVGSRDTYASAHEYLDDARLADFGIRVW